MGGGAAALPRQVGGRRAGAGAFRMTPLTAPRACTIACMVALQIRDVPEEMRDKLAAIAGERGQSLQAYLFDVIQDEVRRKDNLAVLQRFSGRGRGTALAKS